MTKNLSQGNLEQGVRLFFSFDLSGATKFKYLETERKDAKILWPSIFNDFYISAYDRFRFHIEESAKMNSHRNFGIEFWKVLGDEILCYSDLGSFEQAYWLIRSFACSVSELHRDFQNCHNRMLGVKGVVWSAGFPLRNMRIYLPGSGGATVFEGDDETIPEFSGIAFSFGASVDFIGLEMDQGFRLATHGYHGRVLCSPDASYLAARGYISILPKLNLVHRPRTTDWNGIVL